MKTQVTEQSERNLLSEFTLDILLKMKIYYTYILQCNNNTRYYGNTNNLKARLKDHLKGRVNYTRNKQPELIYWEEFDSRSQAFKREQQFKNGRTRKETIEKLIASFPKAKCQGFNSHL